MSNSEATEIKMLKSEMQYKSTCYKDSKIMDILLLNKYIHKWVLSILLNRITEKTKNILGESASFP